MSTLNYFAASSANQLLNNNYLATRNQNVFFLLKYSTMKWVSDFFEFALDDSPLDAVVSLGVRRRRCTSFQGCKNNFAPKLPSHTFFPLLLLFVFYLMALSTNIHSKSITTPSLLELKSESTLTLSHKLHSMFPSSSKSSQFVSLPGLIGISCKEIE